MISIASREQESTSTMSSSQTKYLIGQAPLTTITSEGEIVERDGPRKGNAYRDPDFIPIDPMRARLVLTEIASHF